VIICVHLHIYIYDYIYNICIWWTNMWCQKIKGCPFGLENKDLTGGPVQKWWVCQFVTEFLKQLSGTRSRFSTAKDPMVWVHWIPLGDEAMGPGTPLAWAPFSKSKFYRLITPIYFGTASYTAVALYHTISYYIILYLCMILYEAYIQLKIHIFFPIFFPWKLPWFRQPAGLSSAVSWVKDYSEKRAEKHRWSVIGPLGHWKPPRLFGERMAQPPWKKGPNEVKFGRDDWPDHPDVGWNWGEGHVQACSAKAKRR